jgi:hypothetical protein
MKLKHVRIGSAHVIALIALFVALGGTVYAASAINGKFIAKKSIPGNRLKPDGVTGAQVNESTLAIVPEAARAAEATKAATAGKATEAAKAVEATTAVNANHAKSADSATAAVHAVNADELDEFEASAFERTCTGTGTVKAAVRADITNHAISTRNSFSCGAAAVQLSVIRPGEYLVNFPGLANDQLAVVSDIKAGLFMDVSGQGGGEFIVTETQAGGQLTDADDQFTLYVM